MKSIFDAFFAFNVNGFNYLAYAIMQNWALLLIGLAAVLSVAMYIKAEIDLTVHEEQQIM